MNLVVILILAVVWAVFLIPQLVRARAERGAGDSIGAFQKQLSVLQRTTPATGAAVPLRGAPRSPAGARSLRPGQPMGAVPAPVPAAARAEARRRRRLVLVSLLAAAGTTLVLGLLPSLRGLLVLHVAIDLLLVGYVALLVRLQSAAGERAAKVSYLPGPVSTQPQLLLRRSAN